MKMTDRSFAIKIDDKVFTGGEIYEMEIEGTSFKLFCGCESGTKYEITGNLKNLEFLSIPNTLERIIDKDKTPSTYKQFTNHQYCKAGDEPKSDAEMVSQLPNKTEKSTEGFIEEMLHKVVLEAQAADQRYLAKLIVDITRSGG